MRPGLKKGGFIYVPGAILAPSMNFTISQSAAWAVHGCHDHIWTRDPVVAAAVLPLALQTIS